MCRGLQAIRSVFQGRQDPFGPVFWTKASAIGTKTNRRISILGIDCHDVEMIVLVDIGEVKGGQRPTNEDQIALNEVAFSGTQPGANTPCGRLTRDEI